MHSVDDEHGSGIVAELLDHRHAPSESASQLPGIFRRIWRQKEKQKMEVWFLTPVQRIDDECNQSAEEDLESGRRRTVFRRMQNVDGQKLFCFAI